MYTAVWVDDAKVSFVQGGYEEMLMNCSFFEEQEGEFELEIKSIEAVKK